LLDGLDVELGQFVPPQGAADQQRQDDIIAFALQGKAVRDGQQLFGLLAVQPVAQPGSLLTDVRDFREARRILDPIMPFCRASATSFRTAERRTLTVEGARASPSTPGTP